MQPCKYCDDRGLPCLMCGRACMEYQLDRKRCRGCASAHRPPDVWPVFEFCPYCGRKLFEKGKEKEEEQDMEKYKWTAEADEMVRQMMADGCTVADICDALGITDTQLKNHLHVLRRKDRGLRLANGGEDHEAEICEAVPDPAATAAENVALVPKGELNPLEQEMARMIEERERMLVRKEEKLCKMQEIIEELEALIESLREKLAKKDRIIAGMAEELYGA